MLKKWYVLRVVSGKEKKAKDLIDNEISKNPSISKYVNRAVLPLEKVFQVRSGKKYAKERNFYPGYILIEAELNGEVMQTLESLNNVISFLKDNGRPQPLKQIEINRILGKIDELREETDFDIPFIVGETIVITDGPFTSFNGDITDIDEIKKKVKINVRIFGRETPLELSFLQIDKV
jgi:transcription termination/antitermination protein NusG